MEPFSKSIELTEDEFFNPQIGTFTLLSEIITDENNVQYVQLKFELLQNHQSGNKTIRTGVVNIPKQMFDTLQIDYVGNICDTAACKALLANFNINDLTD